jgi:hypothetical protein
VDEELKAKIVEYVTKPLSIKKRAGNLSCLLFPLTDEFLALLAHSIR